MSSCGWRTSEPGKETSEPGRQQKLHESDRGLPYAPRAARSLPPRIPKAGGGLPGPVLGRGPTRDLPDVAHRSFTRSA
jgi:hypothetical protein